MDVILQHHEAKRVYPVPAGLRELCTDISREVLRIQPTNIYNFIAEYLEALLQTRESAIVATRILGEIIDESLSYETEWKNRGLELEKASQAATLIQAAYRGFATRKRMEFIALGINDILTTFGIDLNTAIHACTIIQAGFRGYLARKNCHIYKATRSILEKYELETDNANTVCTLIQSAYRGYKTRKYLQEHHVPKGAIEDKDLETFFNKLLVAVDVSWDEANAAAKKIQKAFRKCFGYYALEDRPPAEPQRASRLSIPEVRDAVEASGGPPLTHEEIEELAKEIVDSMVNIALASKKTESEDAAEHIVDSLIITASELLIPKETEAEREAFDTHSIIPEVSEQEEKTRSEEQIQVISGDYSESTEKKDDKVSETEISEDGEKPLSLEDSKNILPADYEAPPKSETTEKTHDYEVDEAPPENETAEQSQETEDSTATEPPPTKDPADTTEANYSKSDM